jgi:hypothetical protein
MRLRVHNFGMAEGVGFEPTDPYRSPVFKTGALNRSAIPPDRRIIENDHSATAKYVTDGARVNGKRLFFPTEAKAEKELARLKN